LVDGGEHRCVEGFGFGKAEKSECESFAHAVIGDGKNVGTAEAEDEQHLDGPGANAADGGETFDDFCIGHAADGGESGNGAVEGLCGEVAEGFGLACGKAASAEHVVRSLEQEFGRGVKFAERGKQALEYGSGGFAVELLINDGLEQRFEGGVLTFEFQREGADALDEVAEFGIGGGEGVESESGIVANGAASIDHGEQGTGYREQGTGRREQGTGTRPIGSARQSIRSLRLLQICERGDGCEYGRHEVRFVWGRDTNWHSLAHVKPSAVHSNSQIFLRDDACGLRARRSVVIVSFTQICDADHKRL
jgi:hypothetical protein